MKPKLNHRQKYLTIVPETPYATPSSRCCVWETEADLSRGHYHPLLSPLYRGNVVECREWALTQDCPRFDETAGGVWI